jgi:methionine-gamma-lyase
VDEQRDLRGLSPGLHRASAYAFPSAEEGAAVHEGDRPGHFYGRMGSPTQSALEEALANLEGGETGLAFASGMAAVSSLLLTVLEPGDHIVAPRVLYATTASLLDGLLRTHGVEITYVDGTDPGAFDSAIRDGTRVLYAESPANPTLDLVDLDAVARLGRERGILTVADNTFATPVNQRPLELGIDVVVHSATKYLGGHGDVVAGALVGPGDLLERVRWETLKHLGGVIAPDSAWLVLRGIRTLPIRMERHNRNALEVARRLEDHPRVVRVRHPGLASHPQHALAARQMSGFGGMVAFELDGLEEARRTVDRLELCTLAVSLGDVATLVQHSASMTHASVPPERRRAAGIRDGLLRVSVGLERAEDLIRDLERALDGG